jgi:hypothetical protein
LSKPKNKDPGGPSSRVKDSENEHLLLDIIVQNPNEPKTIITYKNSKTNKIFLSKPSNKIQIPFLANVPKEWLIPINSPNNNNRIDLISIKFEEKTKRATSSTSLVTSTFDTNRNCDNLNSFKNFQSQFQLETDDRKSVIKEVLINTLNYDHHIPWKYIDIQIDTAKNSYSLNKKKFNSPPSPAPMSHVTSSPTFVPDKSPNTPTHNISNSPQSHSNVPNVSQNPNLATDDVTNITPNDNQSEFNTSMNLSDQPNNTWADEVNQTQSTLDTNISTSSQDI